MTGEVRTTRTYVLRKKLSRCEHNGTVLEMTDETWKDSTGKVYLRKKGEFYTLHVRGQAIRNFRREDLVTIASLFEEAKAASRDPR